MADHNHDRDESPNSTGQSLTRASESDVEYKLYKQRWFGLGQLILLNIINSWGVRRGYLTRMENRDG